jgi:hypothetical protein
MVSSDKWQVAKGKICLKRPTRKGSFLIDKAKMEKIGQKVRSRLRAILNSKE